MSAPWVETYLYQCAVAPRLPGHPAPSRVATTDGSRGFQPTALLAVLTFILAFITAPLSVMAQENGSIDGVVTNGTAGAPAPADVEVVVHVLTNRVKTGEHRVRTNPAGRFRVEGLAASADTLYFPIVQYGGVAYFPERPLVLDGATPATAEITVFEATPQADVLSFDRLNMLVMGVTPTALTIMEMGAVVNGTDRTFVANPELTGSARTLRFILPPGAIDVAPQAGLPADTLESTADGFASTDPVRPGRREIAFSYTLPYTSATLDLVRTFAFPVGTFTLYVPNEISAVMPDAISLSALAELGGRQYRQYAVQQVTPGAEVRLRLTGLPAPVFARPRDLGLAVVAVAGVPLLAFLLIAIWRRSPSPSRQAREGRAPASAVIAPAPSPPANSDRAALVLAVAQLDEQFASGGLDEAAYRTARAEQKARLVAMTRSSVGVS